MIRRGGYRSDILSEEHLKELYEKYLEDLKKKQEYENTILQLYDYGRIRANLYLMSEHALRRYLSGDETYVGKAVHARKSL